jgi:hypothetical protein
MILAFQDRIAKEEAEGQAGSRALQRVEASLSASLSATRKEQRQNTVSLQSMQGQLASLRDARVPDRLSKLEAEIAAIKATLALQQKTGGYISFPRPWDVQPSAMSQQRRAEPVARPQRPSMPHPSELQLETQNLHSRPLGFAAGAASSAAATSRSGPPVLPDVAATSASAQPAAATREAAPLGAGSRSQPKQAPPVSAAPSGRVSPALSVGPSLLSLPFSLPAVTASATSDPTDLLPALERSAPAGAPSAGTAQPSRSAAQATTAPAVQAPAPPSAPAMPPVSAAASSVAFVAPGPFMNQAPSSNQSGTRLAACFAQEALEQPFLVGLPPQNQIAQAAVAPRKVEVGACPLKLVNPQMGSQLFAADFLATSTSNPCRCREAWQLSLSL